MWPFSSKKLSAKEEEAIREINSFNKNLKELYKDWKKYQPIQLSEYDSSTTYPENILTNKALKDYKNLSLEIITIFYAELKKAISLIKKKSPDKYKPRLIAIAKELDHELKKRANVSRLYGDAEYAEKHDHAVVLRDRLKKARQSRRELMKMQREEPDEYLQSLIDNVTNLHKELVKEIRRLLSLKSSLENMIQRIKSITSQL